MGRKYSLLLCREEAAFLDHDRVRLVLRLKRPAHAGYFVLPQLDCNDCWLSISWGRKLSVYIVRNLGGGAEQDMLAVRFQQELAHKITFMRFIKNDHLLLLDSAQSMLLYKLDQEGRLTLLHQIREQEPIRGQPLCEATEQHSRINFSTNSVCAFAGGIAFLTYSLRYARLIPWNLQVQSQAKRGDWQSALKLLAEIRSGTYTSYSGSVDRLDTLFEDFLRVYLSKAQEALADKIQIAVQFSTSADPSLLKDFIPSLLGKLFSGQKTVQLFHAALRAEVLKGKVGLTELPSFQAFAKDRQAVAALAQRHLAEISALQPQER